MAKLIFISPYLKGGSNAAKLSNLVKYISTRDGVRTVQNAGKNLAPTKKQKEYIQELTKALPEAKQLAEYETYAMEK